MKSLLAATAVAAAALVGTALPSQAATTTGCTSTPPTSVSPKAPAASCFYINEGTLDASAGDFFNLGRSNTNPFKANTNFTDFYAFSVDPASFNTSLTLSGTAMSGFPTGVTLTLYSGNATYAGIYTAGTVTTPNMPTVIGGPIGPNDSMTVMLDGGNYYIEVTGKAAKSGSNYGGTATVTAVPLPGAVAMFGAAVAVLGLGGMLRRRAAIGSAA